MITEFQGSRFQGPTVTKKKAVQKVDSRLLFNTPPRLNEESTRWVTKKKKIAHLEVINGSELRIETNEF